MYHKGMFRQLELLKCSLRMTKQDLTKWLLDEHSFSLRKLPGIKDLRIYFTHEESLFGPPFCDCFIECYFQNRNSLQKVYDSGVMQSHLGELAKRGFEKGPHLQIVWSEENIIEIPNGPNTIHEDNGKYCQMGTLRCSSGMSIAELKKWWLEEHAETGKHLTGLKWYTVLFPVRDAPWGIPPFDGYASVWYDSVDELKTAAGSEIMQGQMEDVRRHNMDNPELSKVVLADEYII